MEATASLAGFFAAHAVRSVATGQAINPMVAFDDVGGERCVLPFGEESNEAAVHAARAWIAQNPNAAPRACLLYDCLMQLESGKVDALGLEATQLTDPPQTLTIAIPYRPPEHEDGFAVHRPKIVAVGGFDPDYEALIDAFFAGVEQHEEGAQVWSDHVDDAQ